MLEFRKDRHNIVEFRDNFYGKSVKLAKYKKQENGREHCAKCLVSSEIGDHSNIQMLCHWHEHRFYSKQRSKCSLAGRRETGKEQRSSFCYSTTATTLHVYFLARLNSTMYQLCLYLARDVSILEGQKIRLTASIASHSVIRGGKPPTSSEMS